MSVYLSGDEVEQCRDLLARGERLEVLASRLRVRPEGLARLLGVPADQPRGGAADAELDLWGSEQLQAVL